MSRLVTANLEGGVFELRLDDAEHDNRVDVDFGDEIVHALEALAREPALKVLVLSGRPEVFCAGGRLEFLLKLATGQAEERSLFRLPFGVLSFPLPIVAAMEGHAVGGGFMLALYCDLLVAASNRRYGVNFAAMGFTPGVGTTSLLPALVGHHFASEMILTAKTYRGRDLVGRSLFNRVVPSAEVKATAIDLARSIADKPRHVLEMLKDAMALPRRQALLQGMHQEHLMHKICFDRPETKAMIESTYLK